MKLKNFIIFLFVIGLINLVGNSSRNQTAYGQKGVVSNTSGFARAVKMNSRLRYSLRWVLGRRTQRGWHLYVPLIQKTIGTEAKPDTTEFADSIQMWQRKNRIKADGIINGKTLYSFIR